MGLFLLPLLYFPTYLHQWSVLNQVPQRGASLTLGCEITTGSAAWGKTGSKSSYWVKKFRKKLMAATETTQTMPDSSLTDCVADFRYWFVLRGLKAASAKASANLVGRWRVIDGFILNSHPSKKVVSTAGMKESKKTVMGSVVAKNVLSSLREVVVAQCTNCEQGVVGSYPPGCQAFFSYFLSLYLLSGPSGKCYTSDYPIKRCLIVQYMVYQA